MRRNIVHLLAAVAVVSIALPARAVEPQPSFTAARPVQRVDYWQKRQAEIEARLADPAALSSVKLLFIGDSITDFWLLGSNPWREGQRFGRTIWDEAFGAGAGKNRALNLGISGDRTEHVLFRLLPKAEGGLGELDRADLDPDFIVLLIGVNNSWDAEEPAADSVLAGVRAVVRAAHVRKPRARIVLQTLLPTNEPDRNTRVIDPVNREIAKLARAREFRGRVVVLDLHAAFVDKEGRQITDYFNDGLHPNEAGYKVWRDALTPFLEVQRRAGAGK